MRRRAYHARRSIGVALSSDQSLDHQHEFFREHRSNSIVRHRLEHDPEKWKPVSEKIMLKQRDEIAMRFCVIAS
jgi:hypothetical protein